MTPGPPAPASLPPPGLEGLDPAWSRLVEAVDRNGIRRRWHVLERPAGDRLLGTVLCVHGNPTWSYLWRRLLAHAPDGWRVVAPDHLDMGFSERTGTRRPLARRIDDLAVLTDAMGVTGPVVTVAHDWGGPISLGWALAHRPQVAGIVLANTAVHQPEGSPVPGLIRLARSRPLVEAVTTRTPVFVRGPLVLSRASLSPDARAGYEAPYRGAARRHAVGDFVRDIPLDPAHPSWAALAAVRDGLADLAEVPALLLWGPEDPVFGDRYLADVRARLPHAAVHRFEGAGHLVPEDADVAGAVGAWLGDVVQGGRAPEPPPPPPAGPADAARRPLWSAIEDRREDRAPAVLEMDAAPGAPPRAMSWADLWSRVEGLAAGLGSAGVEPGHRIALLVPPGLDLTAAVFACWRAGAVVVIADAGLGVHGLRRALRGARPDHLIGIGKALVAARAMGWPGTRIAAQPMPAAVRRALGVVADLDALAARGAAAAPPPPPGPDDLAAILFTSGSTGPAKGVVYRHRQLQAQREALRTAYRITAEDRLLAAFAPFALFGPALGIPSVVPDMDVTAPRTLTAQALAEAAAALRATLVFGSPAALGNVLATAPGLGEAERRVLQGVRLLLSAGAPVPAALLRRATALFPAARAHTPYGMTETLLVADIALEDIEAAGDGPGVCVGRPLEGVEVALRALDVDGRPSGALTGDPGVTGEISVRAAHRKDHYDQLWLTERESTADPGWHRSGDVGQLDDLGRLWVEGRLVHVLMTPAGPVTPVAIEQAAEGVDVVRRAAAVGVGPHGTQQIVVVVETAAPPRQLSLAPPELAAAVRAAVRASPAVLHGQAVAAVLTTPGLPVDVRHNSKVDRTAVGRAAAALLTGRTG